jgi:hypothetical protein
VIGGWKVFHSLFHSLSSLPNFIRCQFSNIEIGGQCSMNRKVEYAHRILVGKCGWKLPVAKMQIIFIWLRIEYTGNLLYH